MKQIVGEWSWMKGSSSSSRSYLDVYFRLRARFQEVTPNLLSKLLSFFFWDLSLVCEIDFVPHEQER